MEPKERERLLSQVIVEQINRVLVNGLCSEYQHLQEVEVDCNPRHEAFWSVGGIDAPKNVVRAKEGNKWQKDLAKEPVDRRMQYKSFPMLTIRHHLQLPLWKSENDFNNMENTKQLPRIKYDPRTFGFITGNQHGTNITGTHKHEKKTVFKTNF